MFSVKRVVLSTDLFHFVVLLFLCLEHTSGAERVLVSLLCALSSGAALEHRRKVGYEKSWHSLSNGYDNCQNMLRARRLMPGELLLGKSDRQFSW